jgi:hypothetical protein
MGIDPAGAPLRSAMPRYSMSRNDMQDLIGYLKKISTVLDPGLSQTTIRIGCMLPGGSGDPVRSALVPFIDRENRRGGVYGRSIELVFEEPSKSGHASDLFAWVGSLPRDQRAGAAKPFDMEGVPAVIGGPWVPQLDPTVNKSVFYLDAGIIGQIATLARFASSNFADREKRAALIYPDESYWRDAVVAIRAFGNRGGMDLVELPVDISPFNLKSLAGRLDRLSLLVLMLPGSISHEVLTGRSALRRDSIFLIPGSMLTSVLLNLSPPYTSGIYLGFPPSPPVESTETSALTPAQRGAQRAALATAAIMIEALKRTGRELSREKLIATLETMYEFQTGFAPPVTFGMNRRAATIGGQILTIDEKTRDLISVGSY